MSQNKNHFVPQPVIDIAESLTATKQEHIRLNYIARLEAIRDYCDRALKSNPTMSVPVRKKSISR